MVLCDASPVPGNRVVIRLHSSASWLTYRIVFHRNLYRVIPIGAFFTSLECWPILPFAGAELWNFNRYWLTSRAVEIKGEGSSKPVDSAFTRTTDHW